MLQFSLAELKSMLAALQADTWNTLTIVLLKADISPSRTTTLAEVLAAEADFTGYARKTAQDLSAPVNTVDGGAECISPEQTFIASGSGTTNDVYGYAVVTAAAAALKACVNFDAPIPVAAAGDKVSFNFTLSVDPTGETFVTD